MGNKMTSIQEELGSTKALVRKMLNKAADPTAKFDDHTPVCRTCHGSGWAPVYKNGRRFVLRCSGWVFVVDKEDPMKSKGHCEGDPGWREKEMQNKRDLCSQIWLTLITLESDEDKFRDWLAKEYKTDRLDSLTIEQLELLLLKVKRRLETKKDREALTVEV